ncbi:MAG TPA: bacillithiol biosynthesis deacetylase BshB1 [Blastocatellia bacterium]|nr:bacillithiol biosynthesis deacetylase BshB1 [Blastocatellia bacterium]
MDTIETVDALAIGAHPDDAEFGAGGTLLRLGSLGYRTGILDMTRGEMGTRGTAEIRADEAKAAAEALGLAWRDTLDLGDGHVRDTPEARAALVRVLRTVRPKLVFTHYWEEPHPDHVATAHLVRHASYLAGLAKYDSDSGLERHRPYSVAHFGLPRWVPPTFIVDCGAWLAQKEKALMCHRSQLHDPTRDEPETALTGSDFLERLRARGHYFGSLIRADFGEPFLVKEALNVEDPIKLLGRPIDLFY